MTEKIYKNLNEYVKELLTDYKQTNTVKEGFHLDNGEFIGLGISLLSPNCAFITKDCYPVYDDNSEYIGHNLEGEFIPKGHDAGDIKRIKWLEREVENLKEEIEELREGIRNDNFIH